jgi:hypothetical protein
MKERMGLCSGPSIRVCERAGLRAKGRQVVYPRREDCTEQSAGVLLLGE